MMKKILLTILLIASTVHAADVTLRWDASEGAEGYKIYQSTDTGALWSEVADAGNVTQYTVIAPDTGLVLFRISAYNSQGEAIRYNAGAWYNHEWKLPNEPSGAGVK